MIKFTEIRWIYVVALGLVVIGALLGGDAGYVIEVVGVVSVLALALYGWRQPREKNGSAMKRALGEVTGISAVSGAASRAATEFAGDVRASGFDQLRDLGRGVSALGRSTRVVRDEKFEEAVERLGLSEEDLERRLVEIDRRGVVLTLIAYLFSAVVIGGSIVGEWLWAFNAFSGVVIFLVLAMQAHFRAEQTRRRSLFSYVEFLSDGAAIRALNVFRW